MYFLLLSHWGICRCIQVFYIPYTCILTILKSVHECKYLKITSKWCNVVILGISKSIGEVSDTKWNDTTFDSVCKSVAPSHSHLPTCNYQGPKYSSLFIFCRFPCVFFFFFSAPLFPLFSFLTSLIHVQLLNKTFLCDKDATIHINEAFICTNK